MDELLTTKQVADKLKVSNMTIYRYIKAGKVPAIKFGRDYRIKISEINIFLEKSKA